MVGGGDRGGVPPMLHALVPSLVCGFGIHSVRSGHDHFLVQISESAVCFLAIILARTATATLCLQIAICLYSDQYLVPMFGSKVTKSPPEELQFGSVVPRNSKKYIIN